MQKLFSAKILLLSLLAVYGFSYFLQNNYRSVKEFDPGTLVEPSQIAVQSSAPIEFTKNGYAYSLTPIAEYQIAGLVVSRMDYRNFSIKKSDAAFPMDLCMMWGDNLKNAVHRERGLKFKQDFRFCLYSWSGQSRINVNKVSNNHLLIQDERIENRLKNLHKGDQVRVTGKLVNVSASALGKVGEFDSSKFTMNTSIVRNDDGAGSCEIIFVESLEVLKKGNAWAAAAHTASFYGLGVVILYLLLKGLIFFFRIQLTPKAALSEQTRREDYTPRPPRRYL